VSRFQFVADNSATFEVKRLCELVEIERSSYYAWLKAAPAREERARADAELAERIRAVHAEDNTCGAPRITAELNDNTPAGERVNHKRVARVMRAEGIRGYVKRRRVRTTIPEPSGQKYPDLLQRDFTAERPNRRYVGDITYLPLADGTNLYLATVIDCYSRRLAGWAIADHMRTELVEEALNVAAATRDKPQGRDLPQRPRVGRQFRSRKYLRALSRHNLLGSMGQVGSSADNAAMESFFALLQKNVLDRRTWDTRDQLRIAIVSWTERTYHRRRRQARLGKLTPIEYETIMTTPATQAA